MKNKTYFPNCLDLPALELTVTVSAWGRQMSAYWNMFALMAVFLWAMADGSSLRVQVEAH